MTSKMVAIGGHFHLRRFARRLGVLATCLAAWPVLASASPANVSFILLDAHNRERAAVGVPPLAWDNRLAAAAAAYARELAAQGSLRHSPRQARPGQGENLWMGTRGAFHPSVMVGSWSSEKAWFRPGIFPQVSRTGNWAQVGHYSQMIWPTTTRIGCAIASGPRVDVLVCRYAPAGNFDGRRVP
jgi:hypothetical protein